MSNKVPCLLAVVGMLLAAACFTGEPQVPRAASPSSAAPPSPAAPLNPSTRPTGVPGCPSPPGELVPDDPAYAAVLASIQMVSARRGWAVGKGVILATTDGTHWEKQYETAEPFIFVNAVDTTHAWAVGQRRLFGTSDGGRHWRELGQPAQPLRSVHFLDPQRGFGVAGFPLRVHNGVTLPAHARTLVQTNDGGLTWQALAAPCDVESVCFTALDDGRLATSGAVYRSEDAGAHWREALRFPRGDGWFATLQCARPRAAWVLLDGGEGALSHRPYVGYQSGDGGGSWNA